ncbi:hypothetical protein Dimus_033183 [Dionaea muscipula]
MAAQDFNRPPPLPSYAEMIYSAIDALDEKSGSNKTSISKYIESKYPNLPAGHTNLLKHHLNKMKDAGELIFWKNNYMRPNPNFIRRGRGRPPKPKGPGVPISPYRHKQKGFDYDSDSVNALPPFSSSSSSGAAGEMPPQKLMLSPSIGAGGGSGRPRGRPRKTPRLAVDGSSSGFDLASSGLVGSGPAAGGPRPRGRPPKAKPQTTSGVPDLGFNP